MERIYKIQTITPIFSYGADPHLRPRNKPVHHGTPEIRPASIRGQLRRWMNHLGYESSIAGIFGSSAGDEGTSSRIIIRVSNIQGATGSQRSIPQHKWSEKSCYLPNTRFNLHLLERRGSLKAPDGKRLQETIESWLLMGTMGGRATRGAGSLQAADCPATEEEWVHKSAYLLRNSKIHLYLGKTGFPTESEARRVICDTLKEKAFGETRPLGGINPRKTSPLRLRVQRFSDADESCPFRISAIWTEENETPLDEAIQVLKKGGNGRPKPLGDELATALRIR